MSSVKTYSVTRIYHKPKPRHAEARAVLYVYQMSVPPGNLFSMAVSGEGRIKMLPHPNISGARVTRDHVGGFLVCALLIFMVGGRSLWAPLCLRPAV